MEPDNARDYLMCANISVKDRSQRVSGCSKAWKGRLVAVSEFKVRDPKSAISERFGESPVCDVS